MLPAFKLAVMPSRARVFGVELQPYTFAHAAVMDALGNPFSETSGAASADIGELGAAVAVLSVKAGDLFDISTDDLEAIAERMAATVAACDASEQADAFRNHLAWHREIPERWRTAGGRTLATPWHFAAVARLLSSGLCRDEAAAWSMPCGRGFCLLSALDEITGTCELVTENEASIMRSANAIGQG